MLNSYNHLFKQETAEKHALHKPVWFASCGSQMFAHHLFLDTSLYLQSFTLVKKNI